MIKKIISLMFTGIVCLGLVISANAQTIDETQKHEETIQSEAYGIRATVIIYKTRYHNGRLQTRRWNETFGYWVDPYWIDV